MNIERNDHTKARRAQCSGPSAGAAAVIQLINAQRKAATENEVIQRKAAAKAEIIRLKRKERRMWNVAGLVFLIAAILLFFALRGSL